MEPPVFDSFLQRFLRQEIVNNGYTYIDLWSVVHFGSGVILGLLLLKYFKIRNAWVVALILLGLYEIAEIFLNGILFVTEAPIDTLWDLVVGMAGIFTVYLVKKFK